jgi:hypothetical protein
VKIVGHRETSRFVGTRRDLPRAVAHVGSVRTLPSPRTHRYLPLTPRTRTTRRLEAAWFKPVNASAPGFREKH